MTGRELDRLATLIARALLDTAARATGDQERAAGAGARGASGGTWLPLPVRPEPPVRSAAPPPWAGAAQQLGDIAPGGAPAGASRPSTKELTRATRAAAAGRGTAPETSPAGRTARAPRGRGIDRSVEIVVPIGVSNRHIHLSAADARILLGRPEATRRRELSQPGQFAAEEHVAVEGPRGRIERVRIVGPARGRTQLELARSDARVLGIEPPLAASGALDASAGGVTLTGPAGSLPLTSGVIVAARHLHLSPEDAARWSLRDGDRLDVRCGDGARAVTWHSVLVRSGVGHATELHLDVDEANAAAVRTGDRATIVRVHGWTAKRRPLVTERDVQRLVRANAPLPDDALLTPSARDRARALGLLPDR